MGWAGQTWMRIIQEGVGGASYGVYNGAGSVIYPTIYGGNAFTPRRTPLRQVIRTADAGNRRRQVVAARRQFQGVQNTLLYPTEAAYYLTAMTTLTNDADGHPWLPSYSVEYWDSEQAWRLLGGQVASGTITSTADQDYVTLSLNWIFKDRDVSFTTFAQPAESNYPTIVPYEHFETASNFTLGGSAVTLYKSLTLNIQNIIKPTWDEQPTISAIYYCGRDANFSFVPQYQTTGQRNALEQQTAQTFVINWTRGSPAHTLTIDCKTKSYTATIDDDLPLDGPAYQTCSVEVFFDPGNNTDFVVGAT